MTGHLPLDRVRYREIKQCATKRHYATYEDAWCRGQFIYSCPTCGLFHRTMTAPSAARELTLIERLFGAPVTPQKITAFQDLQTRLGAKVEPK